MNFEFTPQVFFDSLPIIGWGMLGIFIVIGIIFVSISLLQFIFKKK